jgi:hypothetical protein
VEQVVLKAMHRTPSERYPTAGELAQALEAAITGGDKALALSQLDPAIKPKEISLVKPGEGQDPDATMILTTEGFQPEGKALQKAEIPAVKINPRPIEPAVPESPLPETPGGTVVNISGNTGQLIFGGGHVVQFGNISGGQVTIGPSAPPPAGPPPLPLGEVFARLEARLAAEAPLDKREPALERLSELKEALTASPPDHQTIAYIKNWFAKQVPFLAREVAQLISQAS